MEPQLSLEEALTELERLIVVWSDLIGAGEESPFLGDFVNTRIKKLSLHTTTNDITLFDTFRRLVAIHTSLKSVGGQDYIGKASMVKVSGDLLRQMVESHPSESEAAIGPRSTLELFESLEFWSAVKPLLDNAGCTLSQRFMAKITSVISFDATACPTKVVATSGSLRVVELGAKIMKTLPQQHRPKILEVIYSHMRDLELVDEKESASELHNPANPENIDAGEGRAAQGGAQTSKELSTVENSHEKITVDMQTRIRRVQEQAAQLNATISKLSQEADTWTQEQTGLENLVQDLTQALSDQKSAHDTDGKIYDDSFKGQAEKLTEELAEAEEDKAALARDNNRLAAEKVSVEEKWAKSEDSKAAMSNNIDELCTQIDRLTRERNDASEELEEFKHDKATLSRDFERLTSEHARVETELADVQDILRHIGSLSSSIPSMATDHNTDTDTTSSSTGMLTPTSSN